MKSSYLVATALAATAPFLIPACGPSQGSEGAACYGNGTCDAGLICFPNDNICRGTGAATGGGSGVGIDLTACFSCGDAACPTQRAECESKPGCEEILDCTVACGTNTSCSSQCSVDGLTTEQMVEATTAVGNYVACSVPACLSECSVNLGTGGVSGVGGGVGSGGGASGGGSSVAEACLSCAEGACPSQFAACQSATGCVDFIECGVQCGNDETCGESCVEGLTQEQLTELATPAVEYLTCAAENCTSACASDETGSGGASGTGGSGAGGSGTGGGSTLGPGELFPGGGVSIDAPMYGALGNFFVLEDSVADGALVSDSLVHTDLDPVGSTTEPSTFESSTSPCVSGTIAVVTDDSGADCETNDADCAWGDLWGGGIGLTLNETDGVAAAWNATAAGVTGFTFDTSGGVTIPMRFMVEDTSGNQFCTEVDVGTETVLFTALEHECWSPTTLQLNPAQIRQISWQFVPDASNSYAIQNFCIQSINVVE